MIVTDDGAFADRLRRLRHQGMSLSDHARHGARPTVFETYPEIGYNLRMTDIQAAIGLVQLDRLTDILARRREVAERYNQYLQNHPLLAPPHVPEGMEHNWQSYMVALRPESGLERNAVMDWLHDHGVPTRRGVMASHLEPPYAGVPADLPHTEVAAANNLQLPMHPGLSRAQQDHVLEQLDLLSIRRKI